MVKYSYNRCANGHPYTTYVDISTKAMITVTDVEAPKAPATAARRKAIMNAIKAVKA